MGGVCPLKGMHLPQADDAPILTRTGCVSRVFLGGAWIHHWKATSVRLSVPPTTLLRVVSEVRPNQTAETSAMAKTSRHPSHPQELAKDR